MKTSFRFSAATAALALLAASLPLALPCSARAEKGILLADVTLPSTGSVPEIIVVPPNQIQVIAPFDTTQLSSTPTFYQLSGFVEGDSRLVDIDYYPVNGVLYGMAASGNLYYIITSGDKAGQMGLAATPSAPASGSPIVNATNIDFNPAADRLRVYASGANGATRTLRLTPNVFDNAGLTSAATTDDGTLTFNTGGTAGDLIGGNAYTNNFNGTTATALFSIDLTTDNLLVNSTPAGGAAGSFGQLDLRAPLTLNGTKVDFGVNGNDNVGFDISPSSVAYLSNGNTFYTVDLNSGALTLLGTIGPIQGNAAAVTSFAIVTPPPSAQFFTGQAELPGSFYYLAFPTGQFFGYYTFLFYPYLYHDDLGFEYFIDAKDGAGGAYLYDFKLGVFFYTSPSLFPYLYNFATNSFFYCFPDGNRPGHYLTNPRVFYDFGKKDFVFSQ